jgi:hypothetical protein
VTRDELGSPGGWPGCLEAFPEEMERRAAEAMGIG